MRRRRGGIIGAAVVASVVLGGSTLAALPLGAQSPGSRTPADAASTIDTVEIGDTVDLVSLVEAWPTHWSATGTKSEPQYVEHLSFARDSDSFALDITVVAQGSQAGGQSSLRVDVAADGTLTASGDCASGCDSNSVRGFLTTATLISRLRSGELPSTGTVRAFGSGLVVCVSDAELFPEADRFFLDPCFDISTGAVLGHYSTELAAFAGATLNPESALVTQ